MPRYQIVHRDTGETWEVEAPSAEQARLVIGWELGTCRIYLTRQDSDINLEPPKVAAQINPPTPGTGYICPVCHVTLNRSENWLWWHCPSCDLLYHSEEKRFYHQDEL